MRPEKYKSLRGNRQPNTQLMAHPLVASTAEGMAHEIYDSIMSGNNELYKDWKTQCEDLTPQLAEAAFVALLKPRLLEQARATLAKMLAMPGNDHLKETIAEALILDNSLPGRERLGGPRLN